ncbi:MAG: bis(5'-nucleosyl)-tetraphosphatase (symmetrical) YqeK [Acholeplasmataceae bacterium]
MIKIITEAVMEKLAKHPKRLRHVFGVYQMSKYLAEIHHLDIEKAAISALFHDYTRMDSLEDQKPYLSKRIIDQYKEKPIAYHAYSAARRLEKEFKITDFDIVSPIEQHVFGKSNMSSYEKLLFISDFCEINRPLKFREETVLLAIKDLDEALVYVYEKTLFFLEEKGITPTKQQIEAYQYYKESVNGKTK